MARIVLTMITFDGRRFYRYEIIGTGVRSNREYQSIEGATKAAIRNGFEVLAQ